MIQHKHITLRTRYGHELPQKIVQTLCQIDYLNKKQFNDGLWASMGLQQHIKHVQEWCVKQLRLSLNLRSSIVEEIRNISFLKLEVLDLSANQLLSVEALATLYAPCLKLLDLSRNQIISIKALRKSFPCLEELSICNNWINDCQCLSQAQWPQLQEIIIEVFIGLRAFDNICFLAKLRSSQMTGLWLQHPQRILKKSVLCELKNKYKKIRFYTLN